MSFTGAGSIVWVGHVLEWYILINFLEEAGAKIVRNETPQRGSEAGYGGVKTGQTSRYLLKNMQFSLSKDAIRGPKL